MTATWCWARWAAVVAVVLAVVLWLGPQPLAAGWSHGRAPDDALGGASGGEIVGASGGVRTQSPGIAAEPAGQPWQFDATRDRPWSITAFVGQWDDGTFGEVLSLTSWDMESAYIAGAALNRRFATSFDGRVHWELEGSAYRHWGDQQHWEGNVAIAARWTRFPWDEYLDTSFAFGQGVSLASRKPVLEGEDTRQFLNHLLTELEFAPPAGSPVSLVVRVHHRSGAWGLYGARTGSNHMTLGLRYRF